MRIEVVICIRFSDACIEYILHTPKGQNTLTSTTTEMTAELDASTKASFELVSRRPACANHKKPVSRVLDSTMKDTISHNLMICGAVN